MGGKGVKYVSMNVRAAPPLDDLARFSAATIHEAADESVVLPCRMRPVWSGARVLGRVYTVAQEGGRNEWLHRAVYEAPARSVLVAATGDSSYGYWGELMARAALERELAGLIIEGGVRDVDALEALRFPVFATAVCMRGTAKTPIGRGGLGEPVPLGGAIVRTGDVVIGDRDGVVALPPGGVAQVLDRATEREVREQEIRRRVAAGERLVDMVVDDG